MRLKNIPGSREKIAESEYVIKPFWPENAGKAEDVSALSDGASYKWNVRGRWHEVFENSNPLHLEIGMGKGAFLMELAAKNPNVNYVGIEKYSSVLLRAIQKQEELMLPNVRFIRMDAEYICDVFEDGEVSKIYLNFSDPWPKDRHARRRLTSREYLGRYERLFGDSAGNKESGDETPNEGGAGIIEFKTDNVQLFEFSLEEAAAAGWPILAHTFDLQSDAALSEGNVMTEYEKRFSSQGQKICKMVIKKP